MNIFINITKKINLFFLLLIFFVHCKEPAQKPLPILGEREVVNGDTIYKTIPPFSFINQDSATVSNATFANKAYVADFFFTFCPSICPKVKANMLNIYEKYKTESRLLILSHTVAPLQDSVPALKKYANKLGISAEKWHLVTGDKIAIYDIADKYYLPRPSEDNSVPGGYDHSGKIVLVDDKGRVRAYADGTDEQSVAHFMKDIDKLLLEMTQNQNK